MSAGRTQDALHTVTGTGQAQGMTFSGTKNFTDKWAADPDIPLVITLHGGTYTSALPNITGPWNGRIQPTVAKFTVPVHARQGKFDRLWITDDGQIKGSGPEAGPVRSSHRLGRTFNGTMAFARSCCIAAP